MLDRETLNSISRFVLSLPKVTYRPPKVDMSACWLYLHHRPMDLADVLVRLMDLTGWNKTVLARRMATTPQTVSKILSGRQKGLTPEIKRNLESVSMPYPDLHNVIRGMALRGPGRPPVIEKI